MTDLKTAILPTTIGADQALEQAAKALDKRAAWWGDEVRDEENSMRLQDFYSVCRGEATSCAAVIRALKSNVTGES
jgi:hypothetical protein